MLFASLLALMALAPSFQSHAGGLIICHDVRILPHPHPPIIIPPRPWPRPIPHPVFAPLELRSQKVDVKIENQVAHTTVEQVFYNPNPRRQEGTFLFPVPKGAAIEKFQMEINGKLQKAELLDAKKARKIYTDIVRSMKDPALLEFAEQDLFKVRIFPFEAHGTKRIKLTYNQVLKNDAGLVSYTFPLNTAKYSAKPIENLSINVQLDSKVPVKAIYSPTHDVEVKRSGSKKAAIAFEGKGVRPNSNFSLFYSPKQKDINVNVIAHREGNEGYFLMLAAPGVDAAKGEVTEKDIAFVIDTSGSMAGNKLEQAKKAFQFCVANLNDGDRFEVVRFSTETDSLFGGLKKASSGNRKQALDFIRDLKPIGGTAINAALTEALDLKPEKSDRPFLVIFLTDGRPTIGITGEGQIVKNVDAAAGKSRVFCFGIGTDVNAHLLDKITEETRASSTYVTPNEDIEVKVSSFYTKIKEPVLSNPKLKFPNGIRVSKLYPNPLPDLFKGEELVLVGRYKGNGKGDVLLEGTLAGKKTQFEFPVTFPAHADHSFIPRLWATRRVGFLLDEIRLHGEKKEIKEEVTQLARQYGIVTPYTAYLIIEDEKQRGVPVAQRTLRNFEADRQVLAQARAQYDAFKADKSGDQAVGSARANKLLKEAKVQAASALSSREAQQANFGYRGEGAAGGGIPAPGSNAPGGGLGGGGAQFYAPGRRNANGQIGKTRTVSQPMRFAAGKNFTQNERYWVDSSVQTAEVAKAKRTRVKFNSDAYFTLLAKEPKAAQWLALGRNVQFVLNGTIYEIFEDTKNEKN
ncbi:MAG: VWA domain-containing protein [Verrucomicrobia subdivision 3 bacterium]|nr:VWA domain-containing protein [Limisphaerales bacterium]